MSRVAAARPRQRNEKHTGYGHCLPKRQLLDHLAFCAPETSNRSFQHVAKCGVMRLELKSGYEGPSDDWGIIITSAVLGMLTLTLIVALLVRWLNQRYPPRRIEVSADRPTSSLWLVPHNLETEEERMVRNAGPSARPCACPRNDPERPSHVAASRYPRPRHSSSGCAHREALCVSRRQQGERSRCKSWSRKQFTMTPTPK